MKIVVVGAGEVGRFLCQTLSEVGHDVIVVESSEQIAQEVDEATDVRVLEGNGTSANLLQNAGVSDCDFFLAMTSDDRTNLISGSLAKALGAKVTIARIHDQTYADNSLVNYQLHFGIDFLINPEALSAVVLAKAIRHPGRVAVENFARGEIEVQQVRISPKSKFAGKKLGEMRLGKGVYIGLIQREGQAEVASADLVLQPDDCLTLFGHTDAVNEVRLKFEPRNKSDIIRVVLFGGSETAIGLVRLLKNPRFKIRIVEGDAKVCQQLAERFPNVTLIHGSATSLRLMEEEQVGSADYFVACTKDDEINIMTCLQARKLGAKHVQLVISKPDYEHVLDDLRETLGVELAVAPRTATVNEVMRYISRESSQELMELPAGAGKIMEFRINNDSSMANKTIRDMPPGAVVVVLMHKFQAKLPSADDVILAGDRLVVIVREDRIKAVTNMLT
ncbi:Trk system potassium transporter TrkA [Rubellicoccus peritrichatus]|uniref:Trk system potassium uptake protein TrkA n=1 Tax=Rubellicoccus peritrichatus TaxID=3080537 RepID=A0AAQ3QVL9_9BACT|nr:Trk system potassium transporter TrkA [Puniceicoccus sp. CR14]WOO41763.1 Trk system potassium transporter TrkA [Puniceicoccus sp. CR14]